MTHILLPTDGSDASFNAAVLAFEHFGTKGVRYTLVHTYLKPALRNALLPAMNTQREAMNMLRRYERRCRKQVDGIVLAKRIAPYQLVDVLNEIAREKKADLIVMGTQGEGNYGLVGRNTSAVVLRSDIPVVTVPSKWGSKPIKRILLANDGAPITRATAEPLIALARRTGAEILLAHIRDNIVSFDQRGDRKALGELFTDVRHSFVTVAGDDVSAEINELAIQGRMQLVAVIHRKKSFWQGLFSSSKAKRMALHTTMPLMVLPEHT
jgi:nucleotide-binding universal stress UspA family protein